MPAAIYKTCEELEEKVNEYFENTPFDEWTLSGLIVYLKVCSKTFYNYKNSEKYSDIIELAHAKVAWSYEMSFRQKGRVADIFAMKNMHGWRDHSVVEHTGQTVHKKINVNLNEYKKIRKKMIEEDDC